MKLSFLVAFGVKSNESRAFIQRECFGKVFRGKRRPTIRESRDNFDLSEEEGFEVISRGARTVV